MSRLGTTNRRRALSTIGAALVLAAAGCGVQPSGVNVAVPNPFSVTSQAPSSAPTPNGKYTYTLYFIRGAYLEPVKRSSTEPPTEQMILGALMAGPLPEDGQTLIGSELNPKIQIEPTQAYAQQYYVTPWQSNVLARGQIICTLGDFYQAKAPSSSISLIRHGAPTRNAEWDDCHNEFAIDPDAAWGSAESEGGSTAAPSSGPAVTPSP